MTPPTSPWRRGWLWPTALAILALATHTYPLHRAWQCDNSLYLRYARDWAAGAQLYADWYEPKTPVVFWLFRLIDSSNPRLTAYLGATVLTLVAANELRRTAGPTAGVLLVTWSGLVGYHFLYDALTLPFAALTVAWLGLAVIRCSALYAILAGFACVVTVGLFPPAVLQGVAGLPLLVWNLRRNGWKAALGGVLGFLLGVGLATGALIGHAVAGGYWDGFLDAMAANRAYGALDRVSLAVHLERWGVAIRRVAELGGAPLWLPVGAAVVGFVGWGRRLDPNAKAWAGVGTVWLIAAQAGTFFGGRHFFPYYFPMLAPLAVLTALGLAALPIPLRAGRVALGVFAVAAVVVHVAENYRSMVECRRREPSHERTGVRIAAAYLNATVPPNDTVLVCVWDRWAELYWQFDRPGPSRHVIPFNLTETRSALFAEWARDVLANPPAWAVTDDSTLGPGVTDEVIRVRSAGFGGPALSGTPEFDQLRAFVAANYTEVVRAENLIVLKRVTPGTPRP